MRALYGPSNSSKYWHYIPPAKLRDDYNPKRTMAKSIEDMERFFLYSIKKAGDKLSFDIETSGFNPDEPDNCYVVGFSFTGDTKYGMYVPVHHVDAYDNYNLGVEAVVRFSELVDKYGVELIIYNAKFDLWFLEVDKTIPYAIKDVIRKVNFFDVMIGVFNLDTNHKMPSLKLSVLYFLGIQMSTFESVTKGDYQFHYLDPSDESTLMYATDDAICLLMLYDFVQEWGKKEKLDFIYRLDNRFERKLISIQQTKVNLDMDWVNKIRVYYETKKKEVENYIYSVAGMRFNIGSPPQRARVLQSFGLSTGVFSEKTKTMSTKMELLKKLDHPVAKKIAEWMSLSKVLSSYINKILADPHDWLRINYNIVDTASGRLSSSGDKKNAYFSKTNMQNWVKPKPMDYYVFPEGVHRDKEFQIDILGKSLVPIYHFDGVPEGCEGIIEGMDQRGNIRSAVKAGEGKYIVGMDYNSEELVITANMSKEKVWIDTFKSGGDLHKRTAITIWGEKSYDKAKRKKAKVVNFGVLYGMTPFTLSKDLDISKEEAEDISKSFVFGYKTLSSWLNYMKKLGKSTGSIYTFFGRPRRVKALFSEVRADGTKKNNRQKWSDRSTAQNVCTNHPIQGTGADIFKLAVIRVMEQVIEKNTSNSVSIVAMVHDEIVFEIDKDRLVESLQELKSAMEFEIPGWEVQLSTGIDLGPRWGYMFPVILYDDGRLELDVVPV